MHMWKDSTNHTPGQGQGVASSAASQAAHKGAVKASAARVMSRMAGSPSAPPAATGGAVGGPPGVQGMPPNPNMSFKSHIAMAAAHAGVPVNTDDIHSTIAGLTQAGTFTPQQGKALIAHNGPLQGQAGIQTMHTITKAAIGRKMQPNPPMPGGPGGPPPPMPGGPPMGGAPPGAPMMAQPPRPPMGQPPMGGAPGQRPPGM